ncbi:MAG: hypothetical protein WC483_02910 [Candidatus Paceibacterota bacterium]
MPQAQAGHDRVERMVLLALILDQVHEPLISGFLECLADLDLRRLAGMKSFPLGHPASLAQVYDLAMAGERKLMLGQGYKIHPVHISIPRSEERNRAFINPDSSL